jgi:ribosomal protein S18 acetylase RimI-like enzyme
VSDLQEDGAAHHQIMKADFLQRTPDAAVAMENVAHKAFIEGLDTKIPQAASNLPAPEIGIEPSREGRARSDQTASNMIIYPSSDGVVRGYEHPDRAGSGDASPNGVVTAFELIMLADLGGNSYHANTEQGLSWSNTALVQQGTSEKVLNGASRRQAKQSTFDIDLLTPADWQVLRTARLRALLDSPHAFLSSYAQESSWGELEWRRLFDHSTWIVAGGREQVIGLARSFGERGCSLTRHIESVWVAPTHRRRGICRELIQTLVDLEQRIGATEVLLWVLAGNQDAQRTYEALGFTPTEDEGQYVPSVGQYEFRLRRRIDSTKGVVEVNRR